MSPAKRKGRSLTFSINATINMATVGESNRRAATRRKVDNVAEVGIVNQGEIEENNSSPNETLSFNTLK